MDNWVGCSSVDLIDRKMVVFKLICQKVLQSIDENQLIKSQLNGLQVCGWKFEFAFHQSSHQGIYSYVH